MRKIVELRSKILVVEDDFFFRSMIGEMVRDLDYQVDECSTTEEAISKASAKKYALFLVDAVLPNTPTKSKISDVETRGGTQAGVALLRRLREKNKKTPAILITGYPNGEVQRWCRESEVAYMVKPIERSAMKEALERVTGKKMKVRSPIVFVVHGHDKGVVEKLKILVEKKLGLGEPIVLRDQAGLGRTIIESLESYRHIVDIVFVLLTPDDKLCGADESDDDKRRARQNVIFELGLFYGYLGRLSGKVILLHRGPIDLPSDINGIKYIDFSRGISRVESKIRKELAAWL